MNISKTQFRILLTSYVFVVIFTILSDFWTTAVVPDAVRQLEPSHITQPMSVLLLAMLFLIGITGIVGFIGMFRLWAPARYIFLIAVLLKVLGSPLLTPWVALTAWETVFGELEIFLDGAILTLCIFGPAKKLFEKKNGIQQSGPGYPPQSVGSPDP